MQALRLTMSWVCLLLRASISSLCQKTSWMGMSGLCSSGSFELTPSVCTSLPKTGAREENGDTHSHCNTAKASRTRLSSCRIPFKLRRVMQRETGQRTDPKEEEA